MAAPEDALGPLALVAVRTFAILRVQPLWAAAVGAAWVPLAAGLAIVLGWVIVTDPGFVAPAAGDGAAHWVALAGLELVLGTVIGSLASLPGHALIGACGVSAQVLRTAPRPFTALAVAIALTAGLAASLHQPLLTILIDGFRWLPVGVPQRWMSAPELGLAPLLLAALDGLLVLGLALALPVLLTVAVARLALAAVGQGPAPASAFTGGAGAWFGVALALVALGASWAVYPRGWARAMLTPFG